MWPIRQNASRYQPKPQHPVRKVEEQVWSMDGFGMKIKFWSILWVQGRGKLSFMLCKLFNVLVMVNTVHLRSYLLKLNSVSKNMLSCTLAVAGSSLNLLMVKLISQSPPLRLWHNGWPRSLEALTTSSSDIIPGVQTTSKCYILWVFFFSPCSPQ